ncbi:MAG: ABC transporter permease [Phycisphaerales bacterium]|nr:ABC transporter permease [Phycisphaerales bacterium]
MIRASWKIGINSLWARPGRTTLLLLAVALATSLVVVVSTSLDSLSASLRDAMEDMLGSADMYVRHQSGGRLPENLIEQAAAWPEVAFATPQLISTVALQNQRNEMDGLFEGIGIDLQRENDVRPLEFVAGRMAQSADEVIFDPRVADLLEAEVGDTIRIGDWGRERDLTLVGIHKRVNLAVLQNPQFRLDIHAFQDIAGYPQRITSVDIVLNPGEVIDDVIRLRGGSIKAPAELTPSDIARAGLDRNLRGMEILRYIAVLFAFLCCTFIVLTGLTTAITQRITELATLRCIGAARGTIFCSQLLVGAAIGAIGGLLGLPLGLLWSLLFSLIFNSYLRAGLVIGVGPLAIALAAAILAGLAGALLPAWSCARITPLAALRVRSRPHRLGRVWLVVLGGAAALLIQQLSLRLPENEQAAFWGHLFFGAPIMVAAWFALSVPSLLLVTWLAAGMLSRLLGLPRGLLHSSVLATPYRNGFTAGALMLGLAIMIAVRAAGGGLLDNWIDPIRFPDAFITRQGGVPEEHQKWVAEQPWVGHVSPIGLFKLDVEDQHLFGVKGIAPQSVYYISFEPEPFFAMTNIEWVQGNEQEARERLAQGDAILVAREFLTARGIGVGDRLKLSAGPTEHEFEIVGVVSSPGLDIATEIFGIEGQFQQQAVSSVFGTRADALRIFDNASVRLFQFEVLDDSLTDEQISERLEAGLGPVFFGSGRLIKEALRSLAERLMRMTNVIAFASLMVAALGMANVIAANVAARKFEFGVLRSIGGSAGVVGRLIVAEALLIGMASWITGTGLGLWDASNGTYLLRRLAGVDIDLALPWPAMWGYGLVLVFALVAALPTAMRLARRTPCELLARRAE